MTIYWKVARRDNGKVAYTDFLCAEELIIKNVRASHERENRLPSVLVIIEISEKEFHELRRMGK